MSISFLVEMAWKSSLIAAVALLLAALLRSRSAADRAAVLQLGMVLLLALPVISILLPALQVELAADQGTPLALDLLAAAQAAQSTGISAPAAPAASADPGMLLLILYAGGLLLAALRLGAGLMTLRRWTSAARPVSCPNWSAALERARRASGAPALSLLVSGEATAPLSWGWRRPVVLIDANSHARSEDADAILAHELAHLVRRDWPALMLSRAAAALFWFNPLVWLLERECVRSSEQAADERAVEQVEPACYAQALLGCARTAGTLPANSMASSDLARRVRSVLDERVRAIPGSRLSLVAALGCALVAAPVAAVELVQGAAPLAPPTPAAPPAPPAPPPPPARPAATAPAPVAPSAPVAAAVAPAAPKKVVILRSAAEAPATPVRTAALAVAPQRAAEAPRDERADYEAAMREVRIAAQEAARAGERASRAGQRAAAIAQRQARLSLARGAEDMERGVEDMKRGARQMAEEAVKLRDPAYREQQIAREAARGRTVTHQDLIEAIPELEKGSRDMIKGAEEMRRGAAEMRRQAREQ